MEYLKNVWLYFIHFINQIAKCTIAKCTHLKIIYFNTKEIDKNL